MNYVVYEVWTRAKVVEAPSVEDAYSNNQPTPIDGMSLCNWHVVPLGGVEPGPGEMATGGLNYRQV